MFELQTDEGPCVECYRSGRPVVNLKLEAAADRWPRLAPEALEAGFRSVHALPMRLRDHTIGALNLFRDDEGSMPDEDVVAAQALADVATIAILQHRAVANTQLVHDQLTEALNSRVVIEQAKGVVAGTAGIDMDEAFSRLRDHARTHRLRLVDVAHAVVTNETPVESLES